MARISVLYVDDDEDLLGICKIFLEKIGTLNVDTAISADDALTRLATTSYDAVVSDYEMPKMNGIEFLKIVRKKYDNLPFIIFTGRGREEIVIEAINSGSDFYLQKGGDPVAQFTELAHKIRQAVKSYQADLSLRDSEEKFREIFNSVNDAIQIHEIDEHGLPVKFIEVNDVACRMLQYSRAELLKLHLPDFTTGNHSRPLEQLGEELKRTGHAVFETDHIKKDGTIVSVEINAHVASLKGKTVVVSVIRDVTERKKAEEQIRESEEFNREVISHAMEGIIVYDRELRITLWNKFMENLTGIPSETILGKKAIEQFPFLIETGVSRLLEQALSGVSSESPDFQFLIQSTGRKGWVKGLYSPHYDVQGNIVGVIGIIRNVTGRKQTEIELKAAYEQMAATNEELRRNYEDMVKGQQLLRETEERYRNVVEDQTEFICRFRPDGTHIFVNEAYCRYFGRSKDEIIGHKFTPEIPRDDQQALKRHFASLTPAHPSGTIEHRIVMSDGQIRWQQWSDRAIFDARGTIIEYQSVGRDISDRVMAGQLLSESEERFKTLFDNMNSGVAIYRAVDNGTDFLIVSVNHAVERIEGVKREDIIGRRVTEVFPGISDFGLLEVFHRVYDTGVAEHHPVSIYHDEHISGWRENFVYRLPSGEVVAVYDDRTKEKVAEETLAKNHEELLAAFEQLTTAEEELRQNYDELSRSQQELRKSEAKYRVLAENITDVIWILDADTRRFSYISPSVERLLGFTPEVVLAWDISEPLAAGSLGRFLDVLPARLLALKQGKSGPYVDLVEQRRKDGSTVWTEVISHFLVQDNGHIEVYGVSRDVTDRKKTEDALRQTNRQLNLLTSITRHDILNNITVIRGYLVLAGKKNADPEIQSFINKIETVAASIRDQIEFTKVYKDLGTHNPQWQDIGSIITRIPCPPSIPIRNELRGLEIFADPILEKVFYNLLDNTIRHGEKATLVCLSYQKLPDGLVIVWEDNGVGIPRDEKEAIFARGFGKNTGLGLFLTREILGITGITIRETGVPGAGTRFEIRVPPENFRISTGY